MKLKAEINLEGEPSELRAFFGLPDVSAFQEELMAHIRAKMLSGAEGFDPLSLMKPFWPESLRTFQDMQKNFWQTMTDTAAKSSADTTKKSAQKKT